MPANSEMKPGLAPAHQGGKAKYQRAQKPLGVDIRRVTGARITKTISTPPKESSILSDDEIGISGLQGPPTPPTDDEDDELLKEVMAQCHISSEELEDIYVCTALQEGMMAQTLKDPTAYTIEHEFYFPPEIEPRRLQDAWHHTAQASPALRTRMVATRQQGCVQVVVRGTVPWQVQSDDDDMPETTSSVAWRTGAPLVSFTLNITRRTLKMTIHHSICDQWSIALLIGQADAAYRGEKLTPRPFRPLVEYIQATRSQADAFWEAEFRDAHEAPMKSFPPLPTAGYTPRPTHRLERSWDTDAGTNTSATVNTKLRFAWAILQSLYTGTNDILFGAVSTGRGVPVEGIQEISGPTLASVPVRIRLSSQSTVSDTLSTLQAKWATSMKFEHIGLQNLLHLGPGPKAVCQFQTLLSVEPRDGHETPALFSQGRSVQATYDLYSLILRCRPSTRGLWIEVAFDPLVIEPQQAERMVSQLAHIYEEVNKHPDLSLAQIDSISREDRAELTRRNMAMSLSEAPPCVHELFQRQVRQRPQAPAIVSWDGEHTYQSLDDSSSALAACLTRHVSRGSFVPLCLGKSKWVAVAILAVLKAGGAFVLLDTSHPVSRLQNMCQTMKPSLIISSEKQLGIASQLGVSKTLVVDQPTLGESSTSTFSPSSVATPDDPVYATFTSGSTGNPKGVLVHHAGYASSALAHGGPYKFTPQSRVLQFASPAFDSCIIEHLSTLIMGGCVCIPSADDCHSNLAGSMQRLGVNVACLTPTVTRIINPETLPSLDVLVFVGEAILASDVDRWEPFVQTVGNAYGPAECSAVFSVQPQLQRNDPSNIGFPTGGIGWVVSPDDHHRLIPLGCPGELLVEGSTVGKGYLSNPDQTAQVFIEAPSWRQQFKSTPGGRLYKTGDLVQCTGDGSFRYLGRKDTQAKIYGQRLELAEIEHHLRSSFEAEQAFAELIRSCPDDERHDQRPDAFVTAFVCFRLSGSREDGENQDLFLPPSDTFRAACAAAESQISDSLPPFMVPKVFLPLSRVPLTPSGKTNRRHLRDQAALLSWESMQEYRAMRVQPELPSTLQEEALRDIWVETLNQPAYDIGVDESFFRLGGDSISAMQIAARCQATGFNVVVSDIFRYPTIKKLAEKIQKSGGHISLATNVEDEQTKSWFDLSPIQRLFFDSVPDGHNKFTMEFLLQITRILTTAQLEEAVRALSGRHSMLRARFERSADGQWGQVIGDDLNQGVCFRAHWLPSIHDRDQLQRIVASSRDMLDLQNGTVMVIDMINTEDQGQFLGLLAHHLVIDLVSWRVLLQDLEDVLTTGRPLQPASISFQQWCRLQNSYIRKHIDPQEALGVDISPVSLNYWGLPANLGGNTWAQAVRKSFRVPQEITQAIIGAANDAFHTRPVEIIQTAVLYSFVQAFDNRPAPTIFTEGHGREVWEPHIDISRTVGWFTTIAPLFLDVVKGQDITRLLELTKDGRRRIPNNGFTYFATRYLHPDGQGNWQGHSPMEILFNYTGLFQQLERPGALLQLAPIHSDGLLPMPADLPRFSLIDINAIVMDGCLSVSFIYNQQMEHQDRLLQWIQICQQVLEALPNILQQEQQLTISDLPLLSFTEDGQLRELLHKISGQFDLLRSNIEDIYPCSPLQLGIYFSQLKNPQAYWSQLRWSVHPATKDSAPIDLADIKQAWQRVVDRHPILRTVFTESTTNHRETVQVVLKSISASTCVVPESEAMDDGDVPCLPDRFLLNQRFPDTKSCPPHQLSLTTRADGSVFCQLTIHHILVDGATEQRFLTDFHLAYNGELEKTPSGKYSSYLHHLRSQDFTRFKAYWKQYLDGVTPCIFPSLDASTQVIHSKSPKSFPFNFGLGRELHEFCQHHGITISSLLQVAWGLVLRTYTGSESVCFGYLHSCRDLPLPNVSDIAGPLINIMVCRLLPTNDASVLETLLENHEAYARSIEYQHCSLADMMHSLRLSGQAFFNTVMSLQKDVSGVVSTEASKITVKSERGIDSTEYDLTINIAASEKAIRGDLTYWTHYLSDAQAKMVADTFHSSILQLINPASTLIGQLNLVGGKNMSQILQSNLHLPETVESCIHTNVQRRSQQHPESPAVSAWDGDLTYGELDRISSSLALQLSQHGVGPDVFVPVVSEKSKWEVVATLAILKAGGAFILLDPAHPQERLQSMIHEDFSCPVIVSSPSHLELAASIVPDVIVAKEGEPSVGSDARASTMFSVPVPPESACYSVFSSGSTGKPKASIIEHRSFLSAARYHQRSLHFDAKSRVLHFASNAFDAAVLEIITTLLAGGCVCIPSDNDRRSRLAHSICQLQVNWTLLTPSVSRILNPQEVPSLKTLVLGGERMSPDDVRRWSPYVDCMNAYGPSEASVITACQPSTQRIWNEPSNIGYPTGSVLWVVNPQQPQELVPIGAPGELLIEGPIVGRGYMNRPDHMAKAFLPYPAWLSEIRGNTSGVLYRTGDLVRLVTDGSISYLGRADRQVKLRGQRIELAEIEHHIQRCYPAASPEVFADLVTPRGSRNANIVASIVPSSNTDIDGFMQAVGEAKSRLRSEVPSFLIPSAFFPIRQVPRLGNGKIDRHQLQQEASRMLDLQMSQSARSQCAQQTTSLTAEQQVLQRLFAEVLGHPMESISPEDNFFHLGGDSVAAMKLASTAGSEGLNVSVPDVFLHPKLGELAHVHHSRQSESRPPNEAIRKKAMPAFSLLPRDQREEAQAQAAIQCRISKEQIEDIYPCTALQAGLAALTAERPGTYVVHHRFRLAPNVNLARLQNAWKRVSATNDILRTRLIGGNVACLQVVLRVDELVWIASDHRKDQKLQWEVLFGQPLVQFEITPVSTEQPCRGQQFDLVITMHHAVYDAWSLPLLVEQAQLAYQEPNSPSLGSTPFRKFIEYSISQREQGLEHWRRQFHDLKAHPFPSLPTPSYRPQPSTQIERTIHTGPLMDALVGRTTAIRFAWALTQSQYQNSDEVIFGILSPGRTAPVHGIETMAGPTIATYPIRVLVHEGVTVSQALANMHEQTMQLVPFEQIGLPEIAALGPDAARACLFQTLLMELRGNVDDVQTSEEMMRPLGTSFDEKGIYTYAVQLAIMIKPEAVSVAACFDTTVVPRWQMERMLDQFGHILQQIHSQPNHTVREITTLSPHDVQQLRDWHPKMLEPGSGTVVEAIRQRCIARPSAPAVASTDGDFSYEELDAWSSNLAGLLVRKGIKPGLFVPIYLNRTRWVVVAILGVLKIGAAFVLLDTLHPLQRLRIICEEIQAPLVVSSMDLQDTAGTLVGDVVTLGLEANLPRVSMRDVDIPHSPYWPLYITFTSGSTGVPKGVVVNNSSFLTMACSYSRIVSLGPQTRVLHFASYAFDASIVEIVPTLMAGGCICVLSELERRDRLTETIATLQPCQATLTPSVLRAISPADMASLQTVIAAGEPLRASDIQQWAPYVDLFNGYGPAEAAISFTMQPSIRHCSQAKNIGFPLAGAVLVTDPRDPQRPAPVGAVGELLLYGPQVACGYLNNPEQTATAFIDPPSWMQEIGLVENHRESRLYRTGDFVRYEQDGSLCFVGRRDNQVKLRGQRLELGEVEEQVQHSFPGVKDVVAEVITPLSTSDSPWLAAFIVLKEPISESSPTDSTISSLDIAIPPNFVDKIAGARRRLEGVLPSYMVPSIIVPLRNMPQMNSGKVNRRQLRQSISATPRQQLEQLFAPDCRSKRVPTADAEWRLQHTWERVLRIPGEQIGMDDSFFRLGGDSISALRATSEARAAGIDHSVGDLFRWKTISEIAQRFSQPPYGTAISEKKRSSSHEYAPFSLVPESDRLSILSTAFAGEHPFTPENVEDILPALAFQAFYVTHSSPASMARRFEAFLDINRLRKACACVMSHHSILRTVFIDINSRFFQVILKDVEPVINLIECEDPEEYVTLKSQQSASASTDQGSLPLRFTVVTSPTRQYCIFILQISHAQYDGASMPLLWEALAAAYQGDELKDNGQFKDVVSSRLENSNAETFSFWREHLQGASAAAIDPLGVTRISRSSANDINAKRTISQPPFLPDITVSTLVKAALSWILTDHVECSDIIIGQVVHGRGGPLPGIEKVVGPCHNLLPLRVTIGSQWTVEDLLLHIQRQQIEVVAHDNVSFDDIVSECTDWHDNSILGCFVHHQGAEHGEAAAAFSMGGTYSSPGPCWATSKMASGQVGVISVERGPHLDLRITAAEDTLSQATAELLVERLVDAVQFFMGFPRSPLTALGRKGRIPVAGGPTAGHHESR